ncbi:MBL fold metallo-hydrolase [Chloroflexota bacterium]
MNRKKVLMAGRHLSQSYKVIKEKLAGSSTLLTSFIFNHGANFYVFSYEKAGVTTYTFIDTGDIRYRDQILSILKENNIEPANIEKIIITHRHFDHCGIADILIANSNARILAHSEFRNFVEGKFSQEIPKWFGSFDPSPLKECDIIYLPQSGKRKPINIAGIDFPSLAEPFEIGDGGKMEILACPESMLTHSSDQLIALYSPRDNPYPQNEKRNSFLPTDDILFSGDLWLMAGPFNNRSFRSLYQRLRFGSHRIIGLLSGKGSFRRNAREQDAQAKEALKQGFCLIRVKPGHNEEFIGSRVIPNSLLADRDLLLELGYSDNGNRSILKERQLLPKIASIKEKAYSNFITELQLWIELGYTISDVSDILVRIYKEQSGGNRLVKQDRKDRRARLKDTLTRLRDDKVSSSEFYQLAESTLSKLKKI